MIKTDVSKKVGGMTRVILRVLAAAAFIALTVAGCSDDPEEESGGKGDDRSRSGLVLGDGEAWIFEGGYNGLIFKENGNVVYVLRNRSTDEWFEMPGHGVGWTWNVNGDTIILDYGDGGNNEENEYRVSGRTLTMTGTSEDCSNDDGGNVCHKETYTSTLIRTPMTYISLVNGGSGGNPVLEDGYAWITTRISNSYCWTGNDYVPCVDTSIYGYIFQEDGKVINLYYWSDDGSWSSQIVGGMWERDGGFLIIPDYSELGYSRNPYGVSGDTLTFYLYDFTKTLVAEWFCDDRPPTFAFVGGSSSVPQAVIYSNDSTEFSRLMGNGPGGLGAVVTYGVDNVEVTVDLTTGGAGTTVLPSDVMPVPGVYPGQYIIVYTARKPACNGVEPTVVLQRGLLINEYFTAAPSIRLIGKSHETLFINQPYTDGGVLVRDGDGSEIPVIPLTKIEIRDGNGDLLATITKPTTEETLDELNTLLTARNADEGTFTVTYHVTSPVNGHTSSVERTVEYVLPLLPAPIIVLNTYSHTIPGHTGTIEHADTAFVIGGTYVEKDVKEVYYIKDGVKVAIPTSSVTNPAPPTSSLSPVTRSVVYNLPAKAGEYQAAVAIRYVSMYYDDCDDNVSPVINFAGEDALTIPAGQAWNVRVSCSVTRGQGDTEGGQLTTFYVADLDGLDPNAPVARATPYTVTYVGINACGATGVKARQVTVVNP